MYNFLIINDPKISVSVYDSLNIFFSFCADCTFHWTKEIPKGQTTLDQNVIQKK